MTESRDDKRVYVYYAQLGNHMHLAVFINGAKMGELVCREEELDQVRSSMNNCVFLRREWL